MKQSKNHRINSRIKLLCLLGVVAVVFVVAARWPGRRELPAGCTLVRNLGRYSFTSWWLSPTKLLLFRYDDPSLSKRTYEGQFFLFDVITKRETPLPGLTTAYNGDRAIAFETEVSPDARKLTFERKHWALPAMPDTLVSRPLYEIIKEPDTFQGASGSCDVLVKVNGSGKMQTFTLKLPPHADIFDVAFSPRHDRIAWVFSIAPKWYFWDKRVPQFFMSDSASATVCVCNMDGSHFHEIGVVRTDGKRYYGLVNNYDDAPVDLQGLPNGNHLSFVLNEKLYVTRVN